MPWSKEPDFGMDVFTKQSSEQKQWDLLKQDEYSTLQRRSMSLDDYLTHGRNPMFNLLTTAEILSTINEFFKESGYIKDAPIAEASAESKFNVETLEFNSKIHCAIDSFDSSINISIDKNLNGEAVLSFFVMPLSINEPTPEDFTFVQTLQLDHTGNFGDLKLQFGVIENNCLEVYVVDEAVSNKAFFVVNISKYDNELLFSSGHTILKEFGCVSFSSLEAPKLYGQCGSGDDNEIKPIKFNK